MGELVQIEWVKDPTCGQLFDKMRNIMELAIFDGSTFRINGFPVAQIITTDVELNGSTYSNVRIIEKKPIKDGLPDGMIELIGRHNGVSVINGYFVGLGYEKGKWKVMRELNDSTLHNYYGRIIGNNRI
jgi:hypothetical protein